MDCPDPMTLEQFLRRHKGVSHRMLVRLKRIPGGICCNGAPIRTIDPVRYGDEIVLTDRENASALQPAAVSVPVLDETDSYIIYNKPAHMPVHPSQGHHSDTLGNVFAAQFPELPFRPVYRLDRDTSGICLAAKSAYAAKQLQGSTRKTYLALVCGILTESGTVDAPIALSSGVVSGQTESRQSPTLYRSGTVTGIPCFRSGWKREGRIRYGCIWRIWGIRSPGMTCTAAIPGIFPIICCIVIRWSFWIR